MNRQQLVDAVGERLGDRKTAATAVGAVLDTVSAALAEGERVSLFGFGVFEKVDRAARTARNPTTGAPVQVPATSVPRFRPGQALKDAVNGGAARTGTSAPARESTPSAPDTGPTPGATKGSAKADAKAASKGKAEGKKSEGKKSDAKGKKADAKGKKADAKKGKGK